MKLSKASVPDKSGRLKLTIGFSAVLAQSETVATAFSPKLGFALIVMCILSTVLIAVTGMIVMSNAVAGALSRFLS